VQCKMGANSSKTTTVVCISMHTCIRTTTTTTTL
jgi:hypothetical protein